MHALLTLTPTADPLPESIDLTVIFTTAGAGATFATLFGVGMGYSNDQIGTASARGTAAGLFVGVIGFIAALIWLPGRDDVAPHVAGIVGFLSLSRRAAIWLAPGTALSVAGVGLVDGGASAWVGYVLAAAGAVVVIIAWEWSEPTSGHKNDRSRPYRSV